MEYNIDGVAWYGGENREDKDYCGHNCYWRIEDDTLIFRGPDVDKDEWWEYDWYAVEWLDSECVEYIYDFEYGPLFWTPDAPSIYRDMSYHKVIIEEGITSIEEFAFTDEYDIEEIVLPNSLTEIGDCAFAGCDSLTSIVIPDSVSVIGQGAFVGCSSLTMIKIPEDVTKIGRNPFIYCGKLNISVDKNNKKYTDIDGVLFSKDKSKLIAFNRDDDVYIIPNIVTVIEIFAFSWSFFLTRVIMPDSVIEIGSNAFSHCYSLTSIVIPKSVKEIGHSAFFDCTSLKKVIFNGTKEEWGKIKIGFDNEPLLEAEIIFKESATVPESEHTSQTESVPQTESAPQTKSTPQTKHIPKPQCAPLTEHTPQWIKEQLKKLFPGK